MIVKTEGIVLRTIKHSDSGIIAHILTRDRGRLSFMVRGIHSKKGKTPGVFFQPLQLLELEIMVKEGRDLNSIREVSSAHNFTSLPYDPYKSSIALFISEVLSRSVQEEEPDPPLYSFIRSTITDLDQTSGNISNFHIAFMVTLATYLGIAPSAASLTKEAPAYFDMNSGSFCQSPPMHGFYLQQRHAGILQRFMLTTPSASTEIKLNGKERSEFLGSVLTFFSIHLPGMKNIRSLEVMSQLFSPS
ncbi:MAG: DNA repair protein RecO [Bacteroidales bacterium]|nr:DNA repair protein RecO [Bacteroidales bacterium]